MLWKDKILIEFVLIIAGIFVFFIFVAKEYVKIITHNMFHTHIKSLKKSVLVP